MITITSLGLETVKAIQAGHNTNQKLSEALGGIPEKWGSRVARLRKQGLVHAQRKAGALPLCNSPMSYTVLDKLYVVNDRPLVGRIPNKKRSKTYREMGEPCFDSLNSYIYPKKLQKKLEAKIEP